MIDRRAYTRAAVNLKVNYVDDHRAEKMGNVTDISQGGMYVATGNASSVNDHVEGIIDHDDLGKVIWLEGRVVRVNDKGMALAFTSVDVHGLHNLLIAKKVLR